MHTLINIFGLFFTSFALALSAYIFVVTFVLCLEIAASFRLRVRPPASADYPALTVLVPAHNESTLISRTLANVRSQLRAQDRCLVVADNCTDNTAALATEGGAEVIERQDASRIGKGYALDFGLKYLRQAPPEIVIILDADCLVSQDCLAILAFTTHHAGRAVQSLDLMIAPAEPSPGLKVAEFAWRLKNYARPLGLLNLGLPCQLMGTGMAFPWSIINTINVATGNVVEDLKLGLDLAEFDRPALFCPDAVVTSIFPRDRDAARRQRQRWEHGQLRTLLSNGPRLIAKAVRLGRIDLLAIALDLIVPPLSVLGGLLVAAAGLSLSVMALWGSAFPAGIAACAWAFFLVALCLGWYRYGRDLVPVTSFHLIARYLGSKVALYADGLLRGSARKWIRTDRD